MKIGSFNMSVYVLSERYLQEAYEIIGVYATEALALKEKDAIKRGSSDGWALDFKVEEFKVRGEQCGN
jgi:hypothetical protein